VETSTGVERIEAEPPEWAGRFSVPQVYAHGLAAYAAPTKAFLDALGVAGSAAVGRPSAAAALAAHRVVDRAYASAAAGGTPKRLTPAEELARKP
jgi:predicted dehydrogenase